MDNQELGEVFVLDMLQKYDPRLVLCMLFTLASEDEVLLNRVTRDSEGEVVLAFLAKGFGMLENTIASELNSIAKVNALLNLSLVFFLPFLLLFLFNLVKRYLHKKEAVQLAGSI